MSSQKIEREINALIKLGISENLSKVIVYKKYGFNELSNELIHDAKTENKEIEESLYNFAPFETTLEYQNITTIAEKK